MNTVTRTIVIGLTVAIAMSVSFPQAISAQDPNTKAADVPQRIQIEQPAVAALTVIGASSEEQETLQSALGAFERAGLELPPLVIEFADTTDACLGNAGYFWAADDDDPQSLARVAICHRSPIYVFHELAHAWDSHSLTDATRQPFLDLWGLETWKDVDSEWRNRASERAADTVAYALSWNTPTDNPDILKYICGFDDLTGDPLPNPGLFTCSEASISTAMDRV